MINKTKMKRQNSGITLIALVVTIVVLIILATVSINAVFSENGIIKKAELAKSMHANAIKVDEESMNTLLEEYANAMAGTPSNGGNSGEGENSGDSNTDSGGTGSSDKGSVPEKPTGDGDEILSIVDEQGNDIAGNIVFAMGRECSDERQALAVEELGKLASYSNTTGSIEGYYGEILDAEGNSISLTEILKTESENLKVYDFFAISVENYIEDYGTVTVDFKFSTAYEIDEIYAVVLGIQNTETGVVENVYFEAVGTGVEGTIRVTFSPEVLMYIADSPTVMSVVSKNIGLK